MTQGDGNQTRPGNIPALERASGRVWIDWLAFFEQNGAAKLTHADIAKLALTQMPEKLENPGWWAQGAAIAFEQHAGLRVPGQSSTGDFRVSASRTLPLERDAAIEQWNTRFGEVARHLGHAVSNVRESRTEKRSFTRFALEGAGNVEIASTSKSDDKSILAVNHTGLVSGDELEVWRAHWKGLLAEL